MANKSFLFPPYVNKFSSPKITEANWKAALEIWILNLSLLLKLNDEKFSKEMIQNESLQKFIETFLGIRSKSCRLVSDQVDSSASLELDKKVLSVLLRSSEPNIYYTSNKKKNKLSLAEALYQDKILSIPFLLDVVATYGKSNFIHIKKYFDNMIKLVPKLLEDFDSYAETIINYFKTIQEKFQEMTDGQQLANNTIHIYVTYVLDIGITLD
ncbi:1420_t:CDS:1, partial [Diversispora eburnea]